MLINFFGTNDDDLRIFDCWPGIRLPWRPNASDYVKMSVELDMAPICFLIFAGCVVAVVRLWHINRFRYRQGISGVIDIGRFGGVLVAFVIGYVLCEVFCFHSVRWICEFFIDPDDWPLPDERLRLKLNKFIDQLNVRLWVWNEGDLNSPSFSSIRLWFWERWRDENWW